MDRITKSLREYLGSEKISHTTLYNIDSGKKIGNPTSTSFICESKNTAEWDISIIVDIYPMDCMFILSAYPNVIIPDENLDKMLTFVTKWNKSGFMSTLVTEEEMGVLQPNSYCIKLTACGFCGENGLQRTVWKRYIDKIEQEYSYVEEYLKEISDDDTF